MKDIRAPLIEFAFDLVKDDTKPDLIDRTVKVNFKKTQLQSFFEELEKIQLRLDDLS